MTCMFFSQFLNTHSIADRWGLVIPERVEYPLLEGNNSVVIHQNPTVRYHLYLVVKHSCDKC